MKCIRVAASLSLIVIMSTCVAHAEGTAGNLTPQTVTRIAKVAGSVVQATVRSVDRATVAPGPTGVEDIAGVCITSSADASQCGQAANIAQTDCHAKGVACQDAVAHAKHVALCDADDIGLAGCLSKYASSLVRHPNAAQKAYQFAVSRDNKNLPDVTVLVTAKQSQEDATQMALNSMSANTTASN